MEEGGQHFTTAAHSRGAAVQRLIKAGTRIAWCHHVLLRQALGINCSANHSSQTSCQRAKVTVFVKIERIDNMPQQIRQNAAAKCAGRAHAACRLQRMQPARSGP